MERVFSLPEQKEKRRSLRHEATKAERLLWACLRRGQLGHRFRRQYSVGPYVLDFYRPAVSIAVEIDGWSHDSPRCEQHDAQRQAYVEGFGIRFLRFSNEAILTDLEAVVETIANEVGMMDRTSPQPSP